MRKNLVLLVTGLVTAGLSGAPGLGTVFVTDVSQPGGDIGGAPGMSPLLS